MLCSVVMLCRFISVSTGRSEAEVKKLTTRMTCTTAGGYKLLTLWLFPMPGKCVSYVFLGLWVLHPKDQKVSFTMAVIYYTIVIIFSITWGSGWRFDAAVSTVA